MKKILLTALLGIQVIAVFGCTKKAKDENVQAISAYTEVKTEDEAMEIAEFPIDVPESITGFENLTFSVSKELGAIDAIYTSEDESNRLTIRKAKTGEGVIGDYNEYPDDTVVKVNDFFVNLKGANGEVKLVVWEDSEYTYVIYSTGIGSEPAIELVKQIR